MESNLVDEEEKKSESLAISEISKSKEENEKEKKQDRMADAIVKDFTEALRNLLEAAGKSDDRTTLDFEILIALHWLEFFFIWA